MAVAIAPVEPAVLTNGEIRRLALRNLAIRAGQRRANQRTMDPNVIRLIAYFRLGLGVRLWIDDRVRIDGFSCRDNIK